MEPVTSPAAASDAATVTASNEAEEIAKIEEQSKKSKSKPMKRQDRKTKDAAMKEIYSESQRMFRESGLKVGYHRPKQRTLDEFLNRYISFSNSIPFIVHFEIY